MRGYFGNNKKNKRKCRKLYGISKRLKNTFSEVEIAKNVVVSKMEITT